MDINGSITQFFYNIIPGVVLIVGINHYYYFLNLFPKNDATSLLLFIVYSLFVGFCLQSFTKIVREAFLDILIFRRVKNNDRTSFQKALELLKKYELIDELKQGYKTKKKLKRSFYIMHHYITIYKKGGLSTHFVSRFAFWSNCFFTASILTIIAATVRPICETWDVVILLLITLYCGLMAKEHHRILYDTILKTFILKGNNEL